LVAQHELPDTFGCLDDALEGFWPFGPGEGDGILAVFLSEEFQKVLQLLLQALHTLRQGLGG
jgi:hypothetical protein